MVAGKLTGPRIILSLWIPGRRCAGQPGAPAGAWREGGRGGEPGPVRYDRRRDAARPAGRTTRPAAPGLSKLFPSPTGLAAGVFIW